ncbi:MAG: DUF3108 domain-containing protein [Ramlibacter sp.]
MARARSGAGLVLILAGVLLAHAIALEWFARHRLQASALQPLAAPMYTRLLQPEPPPPTPVFKPKAASVHVPRAQRAIDLVAISTPRTATTTAPAATPTDTVAAPEPELPAGKAPPAAEPVTPAAIASSAPFEVGPTALPSISHALPAGPDTTAVGTATAGTATAPVPDSWPSDTRLNYALSGRFRSGELYGDANVQWQRTGDRYQVRIDIDLHWARQLLTSQGAVSPGGLQPETYEESRRGKQRGVRLEPGAIRLENGRSVPRPEAVQDTASQFVELSHRFATGQAKLEVGQSVSFWMARPNAVDLWTYDVVGRELLKTERLGEIEAFHLKPRPIANPRGNITAEMWFAPSLQYLPVRIQVRMGDEALVDLLVDSIEQR